MTHGQNLVQELPDEAAHSKCLQTAFYESAETPAAKLLFSAERGPQSPRESGLEHQGDGMCNIAREGSCRAVSGGGGSSAAASLASLCAWES